MQCNWSTSANILPRLGSIIRHNPSTSTILQAYRTSWCSFRAQRNPSSECWNGFVHRFNTFAPSRASINFAKQEDTPVPPEAHTHDSENTIVAAKLTAAQLSRASAQAARLCVQDGKNNYDKSRSVTPRSKDSQSPVKPIDFGQAVPPRLTAHSFLHTLVRVGYQKKAAKYAEVLMANGVRIRSTTLEAIVNSLTPGADSVLKDVTSKLSLKRPRIRDGPEVLQLRARMIQDQCTRVAFELLSEARAFGQHRTQRMYDRLTSALLMQGEIIVGSLLFVLLVKDWELQQAKAHAVRDSNPDVEKSVVEARQVGRALRLSWKDPPLNAPYPALEMMRVILRQIDTTLSRDPQATDDMLYLKAPLQALANLAMLLDTGQFHAGNLSTLIRSMYSCPKTNQTVWVVRDGKPTRVMAHTYFRDVLTRLIDSMKGGTQLRQSPSLDRRSYNTLLSYSLRHRLSPALASQVLEHMCVKRKPPLTPDIVTHNIILRSGTLLRRSDISDAALLALRHSTMQLSQASPVQLMVKHPMDPDPDPNTVAKCADSLALVTNSRPKPSRFQSALQRLQTEPLIMAPALQDGSELAADAYTLSSYVTHLTSTGMTDIIVRVLFDILPELRIVDHPSWSPQSYSDRMLLRHNSRQDCLRRAVSYGPYVFASILNALKKARKTGLAERVWHLAKAAERASWVPGFAPDVEPWCLSVHAYTSMMQCYAEECKKGPILRLHMRESSEHGAETELWRPKSNRRISGWAQWVLRRQRLRASEKERQIQFTSRAVQSQLYLSMMSGGKAIYQQLMAINDLNQPSTVKVPSPDERFWNAALDLFGRHPNMYARARRSTPAHYRKRFLTARRLYELSGRMSPHWSSMLQNISKRMVAAGYSVPPGLREVFIGRWSPATVSLGREVEPLNRRPECFPRTLPRFRPYTLSTVRNRGLPLRRRPWRRVSADVR